MERIRRVREWLGTHQGAVSLRLNVTGWLPLVVAGAVFCALVVFGSGGVRGVGKIKDQLWYVADVATIAAGEAPTTNHVFPVVALEGMPLPRPFFHNGPPLYVVALLATLTEPYWAWVCAGILFSLLTAIIVAREVAARSSRRVGAWAGATYLALPLTVWEATQPLIETWLALLVVSAGALLAGSGRKAWHWAGATLVAGVLFWSRYSFLPLLLAMPVVFGLVFWQDLRSSWPILILISALVVGFLGAFESLFPFYQDYAIGQYVNGTSPWREKDMLFRVPEYHVSPLTLIQKLGLAIVRQVAPNPGATSVFFWPFNLMVAVLILGIIRIHRGQFWRADSWVVTSVAVLLIHVATIVLYQNQFRYILAATPPLIVVLSIWLAERRFTPFLRKGWSVMLCVVSVSLGIILSIHSRSQGLETKRLHSDLEAVYDEHLVDDRAIMIEHPAGGGLLHGFVVRPRLVAYFDSSTTRSEIAAISKRVNAGWAVMSEGAVRRLDSVRFVAPLPIGDSLDVSLYRIMTNR